ncbi:MAG: hypothetical protein JJ953_08320 [Gracilimonas sp.]|uniref:hypothetical protein n=1 Tax=Gracilimonas TaxID=649462 RepID=UPI001B114827|nr:hypothetical protein [Gracilimonas sp.]MBO6586092.1 hypothetical protein [Gracilimonas sp.]MBO6614749.1 hypothetical protein [Gracilimonas sp.]
MIKKIFSIITISFLLSINAKAQFINLQLKIEPELSATVEQNLDFGTLISNTGITEIQLGDVNMGVFSIRAFYTQNVYINLEYPEVLVNGQTGNNQEIPLSLSMSYNNSGTNSISSSSPIPSSGGMVSIHDNTNLTNSNEIWKQLFIYVYGSIEVGNIPNGVYTGEVVLSVDYD